MHCLPFSKRGALHFAFLGSALMALFVVLVFGGILIRVAQVQPGPQVPRPVEPQSVVQAPVGVFYHLGTPRISHFHPFYDFLRNFGLFSRLISYRVFGLAQKMTRQP